MQLWGKKPGTVRYRNQHMVNSGTEDFFPSAPQCFCNGLAECLHSQKRGTLETCAGALQSAMEESLATLCNPSWGLVKRWTINNVHLKKKI